MTKHTALKSKRDYKKYVVSSQKTTSVPSEWRVLPINKFIDDRQSTPRSNDQENFGDSGMGDISKIGKGQESHISGYADNAPSCPVCDGKKYTLVATKKINQTQTVFEKQNCHLCVAVGNYTPAEHTKKSSPGRRKRLSGTGYLRTKKRRRKEEDPGDF